MNLIKNGDKYYLAKSGNDYYGVSKDYIIENGRLISAYPKIWLSFSNSYSGDHPRKHIQTGVYTDAFTKIEAYVYGGGEWCYVFGTDVTAAPTYFNGYILVRSTTSARISATIFNKNIIPSKDILSRYSDFMLQKHIIEKKGNTWEYRINDLFGKINEPTEYKHQQLILGLPALYTGYSGGGKTARMYYCKIWNNSNLIRHFVPVPTNLQIGSFTVPENGMFDIVNQQFYSNQGSGTFTYGKDA